MVDRLGSGVRVSASFQTFAVTAGECPRWGRKLSGRGMSGRNMSEGKMSGGDARPGRQTHGEISV